VISGASLLACTSTNKIVIASNDFHDLLKQFVVQNGKVDTLAKDVQEIKADMVSKTDFESLKTLIVELLTKDKDNLFGSD
jgi:outer membrane murein-binding lipoprotein Lpp